MSSRREEHRELEEARTAELARRSAAEGKAVQRRGPQVHQPGEMGFAHGRPSRDEQWMTLPEAVRNRMRQYAGAEALTWWAHGDPGNRPNAVLFGDQGMVFADPRVDTDHRPVYELAAYHVDPGSLRQAEIRHRPRQNERPEVPLHPAPPRKQTGPPDARNGGAALRPDIRDILGHLPRQAQELLQAPFARGQELLRQGNYYCGQEGGDLHIFCMVFAGPRDVTAVDGSRIVPVGHTEATAHWDLQVYRASVVKRRGS